MDNVKLLSKDAIVNNLNWCKKCGKKIIAMVKADAYGHGLNEVVNILKERVNYFGVANIKEALEVKKIAGSLCDILIVGKIKEFKIAIKNNIHFSIDSYQEITRVERISKQLNVRANVHIMVNTGMNRYGVKDLLDFTLILNFIRKSSNIKLCGVYTHLFNADQQESEVDKQLSVFEQYIEKLKPNECLIHIGGSFALMNMLPEYINMVRVGFFLYGYGNKDLQPVMTINSKLIKITNCKKGEYIGYGNNKLIKDTTVALIPIGYADGLPRELSNKGYVTINNKRFKILGNICMDCFMVDVSYSSVKVGDLVEVCVNAIELADIIGTSPYEILANFAKFRGKTKIQK